MQPTIVVVKAELYCVQSTVEYIRTNLQRNVTLVAQSLFKTALRISTVTEHRCAPHGLFCPACLQPHAHVTLRRVFSPHDAREDELAEEKHVWPTVVFHSLRKTKERKTKWNKPPALLKWTDQEAHKRAVVAAWACCNYCTRELRWP